MATDFEMVSGDTKSIAIAITDEAGVALDVSTATAITWILASRPVGTILLTKTLAAGISVVTSTVTVALDPADTDDLDGLYRHELQIVDSSGNTFTPIQGMVTIKGDFIV